MSQIFSEKWMNDLKDAWNKETAVFEPLEKAGFSANIAYSFKGEDKSQGTDCYHQRQSSQGRYLC